MLLLPGILIGIVATGCGPLLFNLRLQCLMSFLSLLAHWYLWYLFRTRYLHRRDIRYEAASLNQFIGCWKRCARTLMRRVLRWCLASRVFVSGICIVVLDHGADAALVEQEVWTVDERCCDVT